MKDTPHSQATPSAEEVLARVEQATEFAEKHIARARRQFAVSIRLAEERLAYAEERLEEARAVRAQLEAYADDPEGARHLADVQALGTAFGAMRRMMEIELACHRHNMAQLEMNLQKPPANFALRMPADHLDYLEARVYMDVHMAILQLTAFLDGVDTVLRATSGDPAIVPSSDEELIARRSRASALRAGMKEHPELERLVQQLSQELQETLALLEWGKGALATLPQLPPPAQRSVLEDADWARLNGRVTYLQGVPARVAAHPELAALFPPAEAAGLPYEPVPVRPEGPVGTGMLNG